MSSHKLLHRRPNVKRFAVVLTHLPSLPTHIPLAFLSVFLLVLPFNSSFRFFSCLLHSFLVPFKSPLVLLALCLLPCPSSLLPFFPLQVHSQAVVNVTAQQSSSKGKPRQGRVFRGGFFFKGTLLPRPNLK